MSLHRLDADKILGKKGAVEYWLILQAHAIQVWIIAVQVNWAKEIVSKNLLKSQWGCIYIETYGRESSLLSPGIKEGPAERSIWVYKSGSGSQESEAGGQMRVLG